MIIDVTIEFKFFYFILQISLDSDLWNVDWLLAFETADFNVWIFNDDINQSLQNLSKFDFFQSEIFNN